MNSPENYLLCLSATSAVQWLWAVLHQMTLLVAIVTTVRSTFRKLPDEAMGSCRRGLLFSFVLTLGMRLLSGSRAECTYSRGRKSAVLRHVTDLSAVVTHHRPSLNRFTEFVPRARGNVLPRINDSGPFVVTVIDFPVHVSRNSSLGRTDRSNVTNTATTVANLVRWDEPTPKLVQRPRNCGQSFWRCPYWLQ